MFFFHIKEINLILISLINILFIYFNLNKYNSFKNIILSNYKKSDQKNVALYNLPYENIINSKNNFKMIFQLKKMIAYYIIIYL